jgi:hypothetical protein
MARKDRTAQNMARKRWNKATAEQRLETGRRLAEARALAKQRREAAAQAEAEVA